MARILNTHIYPYDKNVSNDDYIIGTDADSNKKTKNYLVRDLKNFILKGFDPDVPSDNPHDGVSDGKGTYTWIKYSAFPDGFDGDDAAIQDFPTTETIYIGFAYNKTTFVESDDPLDYIWGEVDGENFWIDSDGVYHYTWLKYADTPVSGMSDNPLGKQYIGLSYDNTYAEPESLVYSDYRWRKRTLNSGDDGIPLAGTTFYTWVKYGDDAQGAGITDDPTGKLYIGLAYSQLDYLESDDPADYIWGLIDGENFWIDGEGVYHYTWIKYADTPISGMSDDPSGKVYIGLSFDNTTPTESTLYNDYQWSLFKGDENGDQTEFPIKPPQLYTWMKFSPFVIGFDHNGNPVMTDELEVDSEYIGIAMNRNQSESADPESDNPINYNWTKIGEDIIIVQPDGTTYFIWDKYSLSSDGLPLMQDDPTGMTYAGLAYYKTTNEAGDPVASGTASNYTWTKIGQDIEETITLYTWNKFALADQYGQIIASSMIDVATGMTHVGYAFNKQFPEGGDINSNDPSFYIWTLIGGDIEYILPDGSTVYLWDKYSDFPDGIPTMDDDPINKEYVGLAYDQPLTESEDLPNSNDPTYYQWSPLELIDREDILYLWIKFAQNADGTQGFSDSAYGATYMGLAYDKSSPVESDNPANYTWNLIQGDQGYEGADGKIYYTWVKYATSVAPTEAEMYDTPTDMLYMGMAYNKLSNEESLDYRDYAWHQFLNTPTEQTGIAINQNNLVRVLEINVADLPNGVISNSTVADWCNQNGIEVSDIENVLFDFGDTGQRKILDFATSLPLIVENITIDSADLVWSANGDDAIVRYEVFVASEFGASTIPTTASFLQLSTLENDTLYEAFVRAYDGVSNWKKSNSVVFQTLPVYIDDATPILKGIVIGEAAVLTWSISDNFGADNYILTLDAIEVFNGNALEFLAYELENDTNYTFVVTASRDNGGSPIFSNPSNPIVINIPSAIVPLTPPVISFVQADESAITFSVSLDISELPSVTGYIIYYRIFGTQEFFSLESAGNDLIQVLEGLNASTTYEIKIKSTSFNSQSNFSNTITDTTATIFNTGIFLSINELETQQVTGNQHRRYPSNTYTEPLYTQPINEGTSVRIYINFRAKGNISYNVTYDEVYLASADYANMQDFFNAEVGSLGQWGDDWTRGYGFDGSGESFYVRAHRDGTASRSVTTNTSWTFSSAGLMKVAGGEPNGWANINIYLTVRNKGLLVAGQIEFNQLDRIVTTQITVNVVLDSAGEYNDQFTFFTEYVGAEFTVKATLLESSTGVDESIGESQIKYINI